MPGDKQLYTAPASFAAAHAHSRQTSSYKNKNKNNNSKTFNCYKANKIDGSRRWPHL